MRALLRILVVSSSLLLAAWAAAAIWFDGPAWRPLAGVLAGGFVLVCMLVMVRIQSSLRALGVFALLFGSVLIWWLSIPASNDRSWLPDVAQPPRARVEGDRVTIYNVRNFDYQSETEFEQIWEERSYDLRELQGVDLFLSYWGSPHIAHTIVSWDFGEGRHLAVSIETRKEVGEAYSAVLGFFRQFELYYVFGDERDLVGVRTAHRGEETYLYRLNVPVETARLILLDYIDEVNHLAEEPRWYNALTHNCTTAIRKHAQHVAAGRPFDWRILVNGHLDELGYENGQINTSLPFEEVRRRSFISDVSNQALGRPNYSTRIREGLLPRDAQGVSGSS